MSRQAKDYDDQLSSDEPDPDQNNLTSNDYDYDDENNNTNDEDETRRFDQGETSKDDGGGGTFAENVSRFLREHLVAVIVGGVLVMFAIILAIVLPVVLISQQESVSVSPRCPDGKQQPRIDCLPDKPSLLARGINLEATCAARACCWSMGSELGGPSCSFPYNYGFRTVKVKDDSVVSKWFEMTRMDSPKSSARSDIANLETKIEMQTDQRLRIRVRFFHQ